MSTRGYQLRDYQQDVMGRTREALRESRRVLVQSPTGSGKSVMIAWMIHRAYHLGRTAWLVCHRRELLDQLSGTLWKGAVEHGMVVGGKSHTYAPVQVASIQTLVNRLDRMPAPDLLFIDEAHHATANTYRKVADHCAKSYIVGMTATPCRTDGAGLDEQFDELVLGPEVAELIERGFLAPYQVFQPPGANIDTDGVRRRGGDFARGELEARVDQRAIVGDAVRHYKRHVASLPGRPVCLVYCVSRRHARHVEEAYRAAGINARYVAGDTPDADRRRYLEGFPMGDPEVIVSVDLFGEGLDVPRLDAVQLLRPTESLALYLQQVGRALRPAEGKKAIILDHAGNVARHGLPHETRDWSLKGTTKREGGETGPQIQTCENCFAIYPSGMMNCPACGMSKPKPDPRDLPEEQEGELVEVDIDVDQVRAQRKREEAMARELEDLVGIAIERGYKAAWAGIRHSVRTGMDRREAIIAASRLHKKLRSEHETG